MTTISPREHDEALAALYHDLDRALANVANQTHTACAMVGFRPAYAGRRFTYFVDGREACREDAVEALRANPSEKSLSYSGRSFGEQLARIEAALDERDRIREAIGEHEQDYTGWSRFFLVTSSAGHVHSGRNCSSCRMSTTYGWLPRLSGKTEAEAVEALGSTLCSVCFPSAPVEWQGGKITAAKAAALAA